MDNKKNLNAGGFIGYYQIIERIGSGGMGEVYLALDTKLNRNVAIKVLLNDFFNDADKIARFKREALTAASINHANIMSIYDIDEAVLDSGQKINFIVMEHIEGEQLDQFLLSQENIPTSELLRISEKLSSGLVAAHQKGVIHRDIKMGNIIVNKDKVPKILDFGLAKPIDTSSINGKNKTITEDTESVVTDLTQEGKILGTISYMSPEQARGLNIDQRSDIFSLGVLLYKMFTGLFPFEGSDNVSIIAKILEVPHSPLRQHKTSLPPELERIIDKCLQKDPDNRYQDTRDLMLDLRNLRKQFESGVTDSITGQYDFHKPKKNKRQTTLISSALIAIVVLFALYYFNPLQLFNSTAMANTSSLAILNFENLSDSSDKDRFGQILQELLITDLSDNSKMKVVSSQRLFDIQKKLGYNDRKSIDRSIATEVAKKSGAETMLSGNLINTGKDWLITGQLIDVDNGTVIKSHKLKGADLYSLVDSLSDFIMTDLSVSTDLASSNSTTEDKTTISMDAYRHYFTGIDYLSEANYESAIEEFKKAVEIDNNFSKAYYKLTIALWWQNDINKTDDANDIIELIKSREFSSKHDEQLVNAAFSLYERRYDDAQFIYKDLTVLYPDDKEVWYGLGEAYYHNGNDYRKQSLEAFEKAIELDPAFVLAYRHIFDLYYRFNMFKKGNQTAQLLVNEKPESMMGYRYLAASAIVLYDTTQFRDSEKEALKYHITEDDILALYNNFIMAFLHIKDSQNAEIYYQRALKENKSNSSRSMLSIWENITIHYDTQNKTQIADSIFQTALQSKADLYQKLNMLVNKVQRHFDNVHTRKMAHKLIEQGFKLDTAQTFSNLYAVKAQLYLAERKYDSAKHYAEQAIAVSGDDGNAWARKVYFEALLYNKEYDLAEVFARKATSENKNFGNSSASFLQIYVYAGLYKKADSLIELVLEKDTSSSNQESFLRNVGYTYKNINRLDDALKYFNEAYKLNPENTDLANELARCYLSVGNYAESDRYANILLEQEEYNSSSLTILVRNYLIQKKYDKAKESLAKMKLDSGSNFRMHGYYFKELNQYDSAYFYADSAYQLDQRFFSLNLLGSVLVAGDFDLDKGIQTAHDAINSPNSYNNFDTYIFESPFVPLPQQTLGLGYFKKGDYQNSKKYYEQAIKLRPDDTTIQNGLKLCLEKLTN